MWSCSSSRYVFRSSVRAPRVSSRSREHQNWKTMEAAESLSFGFLEFFRCCTYPGPRCSVAQRPRVNYFARRAWSLVCRVTRAFRRSASSARTSRERRVENTAGTQNQYCRRLRKRCVGNTAGTQDKYCRRLRTRRKKVCPARRATGAHGETRGWSASTWLEHAAVRRGRSSELLQGFSYLPLNEYEFRGRALPLFCVAGRRAGCAQRKKSQHN